MDAFWQDVRIGLRRLAKSPGFSIIAIIVLALGIGPNSAIFSMVNAVLLRPLPFKDSGRLVIVFETFLKQGFRMVPASAPNYLDWKEQNRVFEELAVGFQVPELGYNLTAGGEPERVEAIQMSANYLPLLGVQPVVGRTFSAEEDRPGGSPVVLISQGLWQRRFGSDRGVVGRTVALDGISHTIIGVLPPELKSIGKFDICVPIALDTGRSRSDHSFVALARLKPGVTLQQAQAEMNTIARRLEQQYPASNTGWGIVLTPISFILGGIIEPVLIILLGAVGLLLLIACANMASLLLARAASRRRDIAVCTALGASRWCTVRQLLTESLVLSLAGGIVGLMLAGWTVGAMRGIVPDIIPRLQQMDIDHRVLAFTFLVSMLTGILFGLAPALRASKVDLVEELKEGGRNSGGPGSQRARTALLVSEVALALVLSISAGLLVRSFIRLMAVDPGFKPENLLTLNLKLPDAKYGDETKRVEFIRALEEKIAALPGVKSAGAINVLPMRGILLNTRSYVWSYEVEGRPAAHQGEEPNADIRMVTPDFFQTMSIPLRKGRLFTRQDTKSSTAVIIINEALARLQFRNEDPVGKRLRFAPFDLAPREIVGVVSDIKLNGLSSETVPAIFAPYAQLPRTTLGLVVRTSMDPSSLASAIRAAIQQIDPDQPVFNVKTMDKVVSDSVMPYWFSMSLLGVFALLALVLAGVGIYGLTSYTVSQRTHEIGLRMALGAVRGDVLRMVVGRGLLIALIGVGIGLPLSFLMTRAMSGILFGVTATDPMIFAVVPLLLVAVAVLASYLPARRATKVDPMVALRCE